MQNALLKTLEEPNSNVSIIIFVNNISLLLKTIISRSQVYDFSNNYDSADKYKALKDKLIQHNKWNELEDLLKAIDMNERKLITEKQINSYLSI